MTIRPATAADRPAVADLIHASTNAWYLANRGFEIFACGPRDCVAFQDVYGSLGDACLVAEDDGRLAGSVFVHERPTHVALGILNTSPAAAGTGVGRRLVEAVIDRAAGRPVRLVSSLMNLDSFSLYSRLGFVPRTIYQDLMPPDSLPAFDTAGVRPATPADVPGIVALEKRLAGIDRTRDFAVFTENAAGIWHTLVHETDGEIDGVLASVDTSASHMLGPGVMASEAAAAKLIHAQLTHHAPKTPVFLVPAAATGLVRACYGLGCRNVELHVHQCLGEWTAPHPSSVQMPTFLPETA